MIALLVWVVMFATPQGGELGAAADAYRAERFAEAQVRFEAALEVPGAPQGAILHDIGSCAYRLGEFADAVLAYRRAQQRLPDDEEVAFDLRMAERQLGLDDVGARAFDPRPVGPLWLPLAVLLQAAGLAGLLFRRGGRAVMVLVTAAGVAIAIHVALAVTRAPDQLAVITGPKVEVRAEPHADFPILTELRPGTTVRLEESSDRWARVTHAYGDGWIPISAVSPVTVLGV